MISKNKESYLHELIAQQPLVGGGLGLLAANSRELGDNDVDIELAQFAVVDDFVQHAVVQNLNAS